MRTVTLMLCAAAAMFAAGCTTSQAQVKDVSVEQAAKSLNGKAVFVDANTDDFRQENGIVPGAILLASSHGPEVVNALPADKDTPLIFYCSNKL